MLILILVPFLPLLSWVLGLPTLETFQISASFLLLGCYGYTLLPRHRVLHSADQIVYFFSSTKMLSFWLKMFLQEVATVAPTPEGGWGGGMREQGQGLGVLGSSLHFATDWLLAHEHGTGLLLIPVL